ncbi:MAG: hypothetical protein BWY99_01723 [Synergistetes bacterium ADurb.BinA166]|nr:MAG: hypothetical protein BWY99_01723 [Synergistetes bacterium ADurb.BinA166]
MATPKISGLNITNSLRASLDWTPRSLMNLLFWAPNCGITMSAMSGLGMLGKRVVIRADSACRMPSKRLNVASSSNAMEFAVAIS